MAWSPPARSGTAKADLDAALDAFLSHRGFSRADLADDDIRIDLAYLRSSAGGCGRMLMIKTMVVPPGRRARRHSAGKEVDIIATLIFPGGYRDQAGHEAISWRVEGSRRYGLPHMEIFTAIRGTDLWGFGFDGLEPVDSSAGAEHLPLNQAGELGDCVLSGDLPCTVPGLWSDVACPSWR